MENENVNYLDYNVCDYPKKYPNILFFRYSKYSDIDNIFKNENENQLKCSICITDNSKHINKLFDHSKYHLLVTYGETVEEYYKDIYEHIVDRMCYRWLHFKEITDLNDFNYKCNFCYINNVNKPHNFTRPAFSLFTTCFNSYEKILRAYNSIKSQTFRDWEWVVIDDSFDNNHFDFLKKIFCDDYRIRLYKRSTNSGNIGNVKNEATSLCRGKYVLEMDHDDEILPDTLLDSFNVFEKHSDVGFIYMDFANIYENGNMFSYGDFFGLGYSGYYRCKYNNIWYNVACTPNINNITLSHIVGVPNHPRIWRKSELLKIGNYSEFLPICDDYEVLLRTAVHTKIAKIHKFGYIQYMNTNNNNFSLIRNAEINRLVPYHLKPQCYQDYDINNVMKDKDAYEDIKYSYEYSQIWKRDENTYQHKYCNLIVNLNYEKQFCIIGLETFKKNIDYIKEKYYENNKNDFLLLDNTYSNDILCSFLDDNNLNKIKCYCMRDCTNKQLENYFNLMYKSCECVEFII